jgi:hypothetical protein
MWEVVLITDTTILNILGGNVRLMTRKSTIMLLAL